MPTSRSLHSPRPTASRRHRLRGLVPNLAAVALSVFSVTCLAELGLRATRDPNRFLPYHRNTVKLFYPSEAITPGVTGVSRFTTNSFGTRGPEPRGERHRILTIGGSTTACTVLDDAEAWPALLMGELNEDAGDPGFAWVTNSGVDGQNTHHHIMHARYLLPLLPEIDTVVVYAGLNDLGMWLYREDFDPEFLEDPEHWSSRVGEAFRVSNFTPDHWPIYKRLELWKRLAIAKDRVLSRRNAEAGAQGGVIQQDAELRWLEEERRKRQERRKGFVRKVKLETLPVALDAYAANLRQIARWVREAGAEPVFVAQAMSGQLLEPGEEERLWMGAMDGGESYVEKGQMLELLARHNERMAEVAAAEGIAFVDLAAALAGERGLFYDGVHFNELGARRAARVLADALTKTGLR